MDSGDNMDWETGSSNRLESKTLDQHVINEWEEKFRKESDPKRRSKQILDFLTNTALIQINTKGMC